VKIHRLILLAAAFLPACAHPHPHHYHPSTLTAAVTTLPHLNPDHQRACREMADAAIAFWNTLSPDLKAKSAFPFDAPDRFNWHYVPRTRKGITWNDMSPAQKDAARKLLQSALSAKGFEQATHIMNEIEAALRELENSPRRDPGNYAFSSFGTPGNTGAWGWRLEGHHLSINLTIVDNIAVAGPVFFGANPAEIRQGPHKGLRAFPAENDFGRELVKSLTADQQKIAIINTRAPSDIITTNARKANPGPPAGLKAADMTPAQQKLLMTLIETYAHRLRWEFADADLQKIRAAGIDAIHFAWAGGLEPGQGHYYRIHGPTFLIEFDNVQDAANHIHSVWRDAANDFGEDLLRQHYDRATTLPHAH
jgi:hypothetical protein